jgi:hypothetical protein
MRVCVIDGRGGGLGSRLVAGLRLELGQAHHIVALGTNTVAAAAMKQAGATQVGVGPCAITDTLPRVDVIVASLNLVLPGAMLGGSRRRSFTLFSEQGPRRSCYRSIGLAWKLWGQGQVPLMR